MPTLFEVEIKKHYEDLYGKTSTFVAMGHHALGRNYVFLVNQDRVLKVYTKANKAINERKAIPLIEDQGLLCPKILDHGQIMGYDYIVFSKLEGLILETIEDRLSQKELEGIYFDMGKVMASLHTIEIDPFYETWDFDNPKDHHKSLRAIIVYNLNRFFKVIDPKDHPDYAIIQEGYDLVMNNLAMFEGDHEVVVSHHDYSNRNIIVLNNQGYSYNGLIDFEHTKPSDLDLEMVDTYLPLCQRRPDLARVFIEGYRTIKSFDEKRFQSKVHVYNIYLGIVTCSWAIEKAYPYYLTGLERIKEGIKNMTP